MANIKSAKKRVRQIKKRTAANRIWKIQVKKAIKMVRAQVVAKAKKEDIKKSFQEAQKIIDKAAQKKIIHRSKAARLKTRLARKIRAAA